MSEFEKNQYRDDPELAAWAIDTLVEGMRELKMRLARLEFIIERRDERK